MKDCLIWGINEDYNNNFNQILFEIYKRNIKISALVSRDRYAKRLDGIPVIYKDEIVSYQYDYIIIFNYTNFDIIKKEALDLGIPENKILNGRIFSVPNFDFKKYISLIENPITIVSNDCWGG